MQRADVVLFDAPPVIAVSDAAVLAAKLDGLLLVINAGHTRRDAKVHSHSGTAGRH